MRYGTHARRATYAVLTSVSIAAIATNAFAHEAGVTGRIGEARFDVSCTPEAQATFNRAVTLLQAGTRRFRGGRKAGPELRDGILGRCHGRPEQPTCGSATRQSYG